MLITNSEYRAKIVTLLHECKKASNKWRNLYYQDTEYDWSYQEFVDAIEDRLLDYGLDSDERIVVTMAERMYSILADGIALNIDMALSDVVDDTAEELGII